MITAVNTRQYIDCHSGFMNSRQFYRICRYEYNGVDDRQKLTAKGYKNYKNKTETKDGRLHVSVVRREVGRYED